MLARNGANTTKKEIKKQHSFETNIVKVKNLPIALQRTESLPVDSKEYANKVSNLQFERLKSAKPQPPAKLTTTVRNQGPILQTNKSPNFKLSNGFGGGLQINSKTKNFDELNENIQSIQGMIGNKRQETYQTERKQPFAQQDANKQQMQRQFEQKPQKLAYDEMQIDDGDQESLGLEQICHDHESLVNLILQEEEDLLSSHRKYIDDIVDSVKKQMSLLHEVDKPGSNVDSYISSLDTMLLGNVNMIMGIRKQLKTFERHLKEEEFLSQKFYEQQQDQDMEHNEVDEMFDDEVRRNPNRRGGEFNMHDDEFMDDLDYLEVTPSEPPLEDNLVNPADF